MPGTEPELRCHLEPWRSEHGAELLRLVLGERDEITAREPWRPPRFFTLAGQQERGAQVAARESAGACLHRVIRVGEVLVGTVGLELQSAGLTDREAELGYWVARQFRRHGLATRAARLLLDEAQRRAIRRVRANTLPDNVASRAVLRHLGFPDDAEDICMDDDGVVRRYRRFWLALSGE